MNKTSSLFSSEVSYHEAIEQFLVQYPPHRAEQLLERWYRISLSPGSGFLQPREIQEVFEFLSQMDQLMESLKQLQRRTRPGCYR